MDAGAAVAEVRVRLEGHSAAKMLWRKILPGLLFRQGIALGIIAKQPDAWCLHLSWEDEHDSNEVSEAKYQRCFLRDRLSVDTHRIVTVVLDADIIGACAFDVAGIGGVDHRVVIVRQ